MVISANFCVIARKRNSKYSGRSFGPQTQFQKSCVVAIGHGIMPLNPMDAVREKSTVPAGSSSEAEFARPSSLIFSAVSSI